MKSASDGRSPYTLVKTSELRSFDFEEPISSAGTLEYSRMNELYQQARDKATTEGETLKSDTYSLLSTICGFHFKPGDRGEPYGPLFVFGDGRRTLIPSDFKGDQATAFGEIAAFTKNPALRARLADVAWICRRSDISSKNTAIKAYNESVERLLSQQATHEDETDGQGIWLGVKYLQRAMAISRAKGTDIDAIEESKSLVVKMRDLGFYKKEHSVFGRSARLDLDYGVSDLNIISRQAAEFAEYDEARGDNDGARRNWLLAAEAHEVARKIVEQSSCLIKAAECHVRDAAAMAGSAMNATGSLMKAIEQYREVQRQYRPAGRLEELQAELVAKQAMLHDEMGTFEHSEDISEEVNRIIAAYSGKPLADCLLGLALAERLSDIEAYRRQIKRDAEEFAFVSLIDATVHDAEGKIISHIPALDPTKEISDDDVRVRCARLMSFEHQAVVQSTIRPALHVIMSEHSVDESIFYLMAKLSFFVPPGHEGAFALGISKFFSGANMEACCLLVPQLENSLRYVLKITGTDVSKITQTLTQEDVMLSVLLARFRAPLERIFGAEAIFQIEMIFQSRDGFNIRNSLAHGTTRDNDFWSASHIYGCWLIYRLMIASLISRWEEVKVILGREGYVTEPAS